MKKYIKILIPFLAALLISLLPVPTGLQPHAWYFFAIFCGCIIGLIFEPLPGAVIGLISVVAVALLAQYALFSPEQLAAPKFKWPDKALSWAISGFSNTTVWLIFGAFMFAMGYSKTGLGRRIALWLVKALGKRTLTLGYAIMLSDVLLAPFTPSNTARSGGIIFPIISNLPPLYDSKPNDPSMKRIGTYLMWVAIASTCVTSTLFMTALATNTLSIGLVESITGIRLSWGEWFSVTAPAGILLLLLVPLLSYWLCPPEIKQGNSIPDWAAAELKAMGKISRNEVMLLVAVFCALLLWIIGGAFIAAAMVGLLVLAVLLIFDVVKWSDVIANTTAWSTLVWYATLMSMADALKNVGFVVWFGGVMSSHMQDVSPTVAMLLLTCIYYFLHYLFASSAAHATALLPVILAVAASMPGIDMRLFVLLLLPVAGLMGIITPYGTGPSPVYFGGGYLPSALWWKLGAIFGVLFLVVWLAVTLPWLSFLQG
ncbi:Tartrate transporter [Leminorella richardii]|uniref:Tartrate transporter n=1 Tax=Leminorella richardii TaxID=158841 RepID=A0A2X4V8H7_9GAMM|nr:DASS family sodium-coupled anion symporter [Leminorella richardii]SQI44478.1 Tartrate transporter [Leminorella richardii]